MDLNEVVDWIIDTHKENLRLTIEREALKWEIKNPNKIYLEEGSDEIAIWIPTKSVSYTHLTLPTILLV